MNNPGFGMGTPPAKGKQGMKKGVIGADISSVNEQLNQVSRRLRDLEERYSNLQKKTQMTDQNMLTNHRKIAKEVKTTNSEMSDIRKEIRELKENVVLVIDELKNCARKDEVKTLENCEVIKEGDANYKEALSAVIQAKKEFVQNKYDEAQREIKELENKLSSL